MKKEQRHFTNDYTILDESTVELALTDLTTNIEYKTYFDLKFYDEVKKHYWGVILKKGELPYIRAGGNRNRENSSHGGRLHRFVYVLEHGVNGFTKERHIIDHINGNSLDNRICNLNAVSHLENSQNKRISKRNKSGYTGVRFEESRNKWVAYITFNKKQMTLGSFKDKEEAITVRKKAEEKYFKYKNKISNEREKTDEL